MTPAQLHALSRVEATAMERAERAQRRHGGRGSRNAPMPGSGADLLAMSRQLNGGR